MENQDVSTQTAPTPRPKDWALWIFVSGIPVVGIIMLFVWAFGNERRQNRKNWAKGMLLIIAIALVLYIIFAIFIGGLAILGASSQ